MLISMAGGDSNFEQQLEEFMTKPASSTFNLPVNSLFEGFKNTTPDPTPLSLVECLGKYLTSTEVGARKSATKLLSESLLLFESLSGSEITTLVDFYCNRMKDHHSVVPQAVAGFMALTCRDSFRLEDSTRIMATLGQDAYVPTMVQSDRANALITVSNLLRSSLSELQKMDGFVKNWIMIIDGEKDPRNLLKIFNLSHTIIKSFPLGDDAEEMFEVHACYFPIDFTPPPGEEFPVSKQELCDLLKRLMSATPDFAEFCLPLLIEKLSSDLQSAKQDSLATLVDCCEVYTVDDLRPFTKQLAQMLLRETLLALNGETERLAFEAIRALAKCLSAPNRDGLSNYTDLEVFCADFLKDCKHHLMEPEQKLVTPSIRVLQSLIESSQRAANQVLPVTAQLAEMAYRPSTSESKKAKLLNIQCDLVEKSQWFKHKQTYSELKQQLLLEYTIHPISNNVDSVVATLKCLSNVCSVANEQQVPSLMNIGLQYLDHENPEVMVAACKFLATLYHHHHTTYRDLLERQLLANHKQLVSDSTDAQLKHIVLLDSICGATLEESQGILLCFLEKLAQSLQGSQTKNITTLIPALEKLVQGSSVPSLDSSQFARLLSSVDSLETPLEDSIMTKLAGIISHLTAKLDANSIESVLIAVKPRLSASSQLHPTHIRFIQVFISSLPAQISFKPKDVLELVAQIKSNAPPGSQVQLVSICKICGACLNKMTREQADEVVSTCLNEREQFSTICFIHLMGWLMKALVLSGYNKAVLQLLDMVIPWLSGPDMQRESAEIFRVVLEEFPDVMTTSQSSVIKLLYKQRFFSQTFPRLHQLFEEASKRGNLLGELSQALSHIIRLVPKKAILTEKTKLMKVLLTLLSSDNSGVLLGAINLLAEDTSLLQGHLDIVIPRLLTCSTSIPQMNVRVASLKCLRSLSMLPASAIHSYTNSVIKGLFPALDDKKRLVRKEAVAARNLWCLIRDGV